MYRKIGGHNYPWVYSGPIGAIITPQFHGVTEDTWLPFASSLCGACAEVCPVKIEIPKLLLKLREEVTEVQAARKRSGRFGALRIPAFRLDRDSSEDLLCCWRAWDRYSIPLLPKIGPLKKWASQRRLPEPAQHSFHQWWAARKGSS